METPFDYDNTSRFFRKPILFYYKNEECHTVNVILYS